MEHTLIRSFFELGPLSRSEFDLMMFLHRHPNSLLTMEDLAIRVGHHQAHIESALHNLTRVGLVSARVVRPRDRATYRLVTGTDRRWVELMSQRHPDPRRRMRIRRLLRHHEAIYRSVLATTAKARALVQASATLQGVAGELLAKISSRLVDTRRLRGQLRTYRGTSVSASVREPRIEP
jgi:DNA-binding MarR family transcriptional regulator